MSKPIDYAVLTNILLTVADRIKDAKERLCKLDSATGDGDHGAAMAKVADAVRTTVEGHGDTDPAALLDAIAWAAMGTDGGSTSPLYGSLFLGMGQSLSSIAFPLDAAGFAAMLDAGVTQLRTNTRAKPGDKTMIDALVPAADALREAAASGKELAACLEAAVQAAAAGAEATTGMQATFGRAKNIGERSVGHMDPGAASTALFFEAVKEGYTNA